MNNKSGMSYFRECWQGIDMGYRSIIKILEEYGQDSNNIFDRRRPERDSVCVHQQ